MARKAASAFHPGRAIDNAKAIGEGDLQVLVDYLRELHSIPWKHNGEQRARLLEDRAGWALIYAEALRAHLALKGRGQPRKLFTMSDGIRAVEAARWVETQVAKKGTRSKARIEKDAMVRFEITRAILRAALTGRLAETELPGIPRAEK
jgi:hypothetical protein